MNDEPNTSSFRSFNDWGAVVLLIVSLEGSRPGNPSDSGGALLYIRCHDGFAAKRAEAARHGPAEDRVPKRRLVWRSDFMIAVAMTIQLHRGNAIGQRRRTTTAN